MEGGSSNLTRTTRKICRGRLIFNYGSCLRNRLGRYDRINDIVCRVVNQTILMKRAGTL